MTLFSARDTNVILNKSFNISLPHISSKERKILVVLCLEIPPFGGHCIYACMSNIFGCLVFQRICSCILNQYCKFEKRVLLRSAPWWLHQVLILFRKDHLRNILKAMKFCVIITLTLLIRPPNKASAKTFVRSTVGWDGK